MENASDAIVMAGAMLIFVIALTMAMTLFNEARATADVVLFATDKTNYYEMLDITSNIKNRVVGLETIIPTLYKYYKENYTVVFLEKDDGTNNAKGLKLYESQTNAHNWLGNDSHNTAGIPPVAYKYPGMENEKKKTGNIICSFDSYEETVRTEPWAGNQEEAKNNVDAFLKGGIYVYPSDSTKSYNYGILCNKGGFVEKYKNTKFRETIGEYSTNEKNSFASTLDQGIRNNKNKRVIIYQVID